MKKARDETLLLVSLHVDHLLVIARSGELLAELKKQMKNVFEMFVLGEMTYFLGMKVSQTQQTIFINQKAFALKILKKLCIEITKQSIL